MDAPLDAMIAVYLAVGTFVLGVLAGWLLKGAHFAGVVRGHMRTAHARVREGVRTGVCPECRVAGLFQVYDGCWHCDACGWTHRDDLLHGSDDDGEQVTR